MTYKELQDIVMERTNLTSADARTKIKKVLNVKYRRLISSIGLGKVRRTTVTFPTISTNQTYTLSTAITTPSTNIVKPFQLFYTAGNKVLDEVTEGQIRQQDPDLSRTGAPESYVVHKYTATSVIVRIYPTANAAYTITVDGLAAGTDMVADGDIPAFPEDYHDILEHEALDELLMKLEKPDLAKIEKAEAVIRTRELRYFLAKSAMLHRQQGSTYWWWGPYIDRRWGWF